MTEKWTLERGTIRNEDGDVLASVPYSLGDEADHRRARLIAAAPELLELAGTLAASVRALMGWAPAEGHTRHDYDADLEAIWAEATHVVKERVAALLERIEG